LKKQLLALLLACVSVPALAATTPNSFIAPQVPTTGSVRFVAGTDAADVPKVVYTGAANGSRCYGLAAGSFASSAVTLNVSFVSASGGNSIWMGGFSVAAFAGRDTNSVSIMPGGVPIDANGNFYVQLAPGNQLRVAPTNGWSTISAGQNLTVFATCADF